MYFKVDTEMYDAGELGAEFVRSAEKTAEEYEAFEFLTSAFGAMTPKQREDFLSFATAFHEFRKEFEGKHSNIEKITKEWRGK